MKFPVLPLLFALLCTACGQQESGPPEYVSFTAEELEQAELLKNQVGVSSLSGSAAELNALNTQVDVAEPQRNPEFESFRTSASQVWTVNNPTLNIRSEPNVGSALLATLSQGDTVNVTEIHDAAWAKIAWNDSEAYVALRFLSKRLGESELAEDKVQYEGFYFVNFDFLNVRKNPDTEAELLGTLPGQAIIKPLSLDDTWARIQFEGNEGYAAREYLAPFEPNYSVRQVQFDLPIVQYDAETNNVALLTEVIVALKAEGKTFITFGDLYNLLKEQQVRDARLPPNTVILTLTNLTPQTLDEVSDAIYAQNVKAVGFIQTSDIGIDGITERKLVNVQANGVEIQSATHLGEDLRSLTDDQVLLELQQSKTILEELISKPILAVHYPFGATNGRIQELSKDTGYLFGIGGGIQSSFTRNELLRLPTITIDVTKTAQQMRQLIMGESAQSSSQSSE